KGLSMGEPAVEQMDGLTLTECLAHFEAKGYTGHFGAAEGGLVRCFSCHTDSKPEDVVLDGICRVEGVSDPDDMLAVLGLTCPRARAMSVAAACSWPGGWRMRMRACGRAKRLPGVPAQSRNCPIDAAMPMHSVATSQPTYCMVS